MQITEILEKQRNIYIDFFKKQATNCKGNCEMLLESRTEEREEYFRLYRIDCVENESDEFKIIEFNNDSYINHAPIVYQINEMKIKLHPFFWNSCEIELDEAFEDWGPVIAWVKKWIEDSDDVEEEEEKASSGATLTFKIHNFQRPITAASSSKLAIDFGTAEVEAFIELIKLFEKMGVEKMEVHSREMIKSFKA